jgi:hypothetical protein
MTGDPCLPDHAPQSDRDHDQPGTELTAPPLVVEKGRQFGMVPR